MSITPSTGQWGFETTIEVSPDLAKFIGALASPTFPQRNDIWVEFVDEHKMEMVNRDYADALEWEREREAY